MVERPFCIGGAGYQGGPHPRHQFCGRCRARSIGPRSSSKFVCCRCGNLAPYNRDKNAKRDKRRSPNDKKRRISA